MFSFLALIMIFMHLFVCFYLMPVSLLVQTLKNGLMSVFPLVYIQSLAECLVQNNTHQIFANDLDEYVNIR